MDVFPSNNLRISLFLFFCSSHFWYESHSLSSIYTTQHCPPVLSPPISFFRILTRNACTPPTHPHNKLQFEFLAIHSMQRPWPGKTHCIALHSTVQHLRLLHFMLPTLKPALKRQKKIFSFTCIFHLLCPVITQHDAYT